MAADLYSSRDRRESISVVIENIDSIVNAKHRCTSVELLTKIQIDVAETSKDVVSLAAMLQELNATMLSYQAGTEKQSDKLWKQIEDTEKETADSVKAIEKNVALILKQQEDELRQWAPGSPRMLVFDRVATLEAAEHRRQGAGKWEALIINAVMSVIVAVVVIIAAYLMGGGRIV
jgi:hypothetical protein